MKKFFVVGGNFGGKFCLFLLTAQSNQRDTVCIW
jgi:hypothetical protein